MHSFGACAPEPEWCPWDRGPRPKTGVQNESLSSVLEVCVSCKFQRVPCTWTWEVPIVSSCLPWAPGAAKVWPWTWPWVRMGMAATQGEGEFPRLFLAEARMQTGSQVARRALA